ncbi:MAG TPA: DUF1697 domain-containing protein [bacterium]|nr:DUF1697 domain-containing protein [bacterium]HMW34254.1 DUF1697 domain-containing protein [bacterium]HMW35988.1 DUF1697 domain-containing protein [bacterium]HMY36254.1 DUF1697 domain-containing protein [bacterium]HMZ04485.1 DUF1697 domain-containing protein [bacterium]
MSTYIALLRGINVSGQKLIKMNDLKSYFVSYGYKNVQTYIQSGNVVFESAKQESEKLSKKVGEQLAVSLGYIVPVIARSLNEWVIVNENNPYAKKKLRPDERVYVTLLAIKPKPDLAQSLNALSDTKDEFQLNGKTVYILCRKGYGNSKFSNNFIEKKLDTQATTRNLATMQKLQMIAEGLI